MKKQDNIVLLMVGFFIDEMCESGITTSEEITNYFNNCKEKEFKQMIKEYKKYNSLTRNKAVKKVIELKKVISRYQNK